MASTLVQTRSTARLPPRDEPSIWRRAIISRTGLKPPLDYSVYSASAGALLLALHEPQPARRRTEV